MPQPFEEQAISPSDLVELRDAFNVRGWGAANLFFTFNEPAGRWEAWRRNGPALTLVAHNRPEGGWTVLVP